MFCLDFDEKMYFRWDVPKGENMVMEILKIQLVRMSLVSDADS